MSNRKPYVREMKRTWWTESNFYRFYMIREATVLPLVFFTVCLTFGLGSLVRGETSWNTWLHFMSNPIVIFINILALLGSLYHGYTYFKMMPQVVPMQVKGKPIDKKLIILAQWIIVAIITVICLAVV
jgi:fumarate reductase subunit C